jgi:Branched-chain amino acid ABC-type transport system, permease components
MAALLGVNVDRTISLTFVIGAALAAVAGMMVLLYYGQIDFFIGFLVASRPSPPRFSAASAPCPGPCWAGC